MSIQDLSFEEISLLTGTSNWKWPEVEGLDDFKGSLIHTAAWPKDFDYTNKTVAVIGNGASGVQLLPAIQPGEPAIPMERCPEGMTDNQEQM